MPCFVWGTWWATWWWVWPLVMIAMMAVAFVAMRACARRARAGGGMGACCGPAAARGEDAVDVLRRRYAEGELTKEEFDAMKGHVTA